MVRISGRDCTCPYCKRNLGIEIDHVFPDNKDLESIKIVKDPFDYDDDGE